jgi:predicted transcriptional regulator
LNYAIRFFAGELSLNEITTAKGKTIHLLNLPYFLAGQTELYIKWLQQNIPEVPKDIVSEPRIVYPKQKKTEEVFSSVEELTPKHFRILRYCKNEPKKGKDIIENCLGLHYQSRNKRVFINQLHELELLEWTKENPKDKQQAYRLTEKGKGLIE